MPFDLASLQRGTISRPPRIVLLGVEKIGKSTFASQAESPAFISIDGEEGIDGLDVFKWPQPARTLDDVVECLRTLYEADHGCKTVVVDSASALEPINWKATCKRCPHKDGTIPDNIEKVHGGWGKGHTEALVEWDVLTKWLDVLRADRNMVCIVIGHVKIRTFYDPSGLSYDQYQFDIHEKAANKLFRWADSILFCNTKVLVKKEGETFGRDIKKAIDITGGQRFLYTQKRPAHPGGGRDVYGHLPYELPLSWDVYQQAIITASEKGTQ